jgi:two-component system OmpR family response regulator
MIDKKTFKIFLVDDDAVFLRLLEIEFCQYREFCIETFATGELCIESLSSRPDMVILDYHLDGIDQNVLNGIQTLDKIKSIDKEISVVMLSSQDKIDIAVNCMHHGAYDYVVKSETSFTRLQKNIASIILLREMEKQINWYKVRM